uniref:Uncharacterized protein n=1 Tax=Siphoviridae sp. ctqSm5 TaxID=2827949 RepID=A0A8S5SNV5_9CAUD|nr:MAG TPA: hypothetical protein [Siphoviridae sp. ctqSm5]
MFILNYLPLNYFTFIKLYDKLLLTIEQRRE